MKNRLYFCLIAIILSSAPGTLLAQDYAYHPALSDRFTVIVGAFKSNNAFNVEADVLGDPGDDIDFDDSLNVSDSSTFLSGQIRWKFSKKKRWSIAGQYFSNDATGETVLTEDVEWDGYTYREGSFVNSGVKLAVTRLFIGRSFILNDRSDIGAGIGIHNLDMNIFIEGEIDIDEETTGFQRAEVGDNQPLPNVGGWYSFSPAKKWLLHVRVDWISANIGDYDGTLWNVNAGVNYQAWRHVGIDLSWQYFNLDLKVDKSDWKGRADMTYSGPVLAITGNW